MNIFKLLNIHKKTALPLSRSVRFSAVKKVYLQRVISILTKIHKIVLIERCFQGQPVNRVINLFRVERNRPTLHYTDY